jgi:hypothetical protein
VLPNLPKSLLPSTLIGLGKFYYLPSRREPVIFVKTITSTHIYSYLKIAREDAARRFALVMDRCGA